MLFKPANEQNHSSTLVIPGVMHCNWNFGVLLDKKWSSVTVNNNSPNQDYDHPDDQTQPTFEMTPGFKPFTVLHTMLVTYDSRKYKIILSKSALANPIALSRG